MDEKCVIEKVSTIYGFKKTNKTFGMSTLLDCSFWETGYPGMYITDYDINVDIDLKKNKTAMLFILGKGSIIISEEIMEDEKAMKAIMDRFFNKFSIKKT